MSFIEGYHWGLSGFLKANKPSKPGGIVMSDRLGVTEGFQDCVGFQDLLLDPGGDVSSHTEIKILIFSISLHFNFGGRN